MSVRENWTLANAVLFSENSDSKIRCMLQEVQEAGEAVIERPAAEAGELQAFKSV